MDSSEYPCTCKWDVAKKGHDHFCVHYYGQDKPWFVQGDPGDEHEERSVNKEADALVEGHRGEDYGHPSIDLGRTAKLWTALFDYNFTASDVAQAMRMVKESRLRNSPRHRDSLVDICGYARTQEMVWEKEEGR